MRREKLSRRKSFDRKTSPYLYWCANADLLHLRGAPEWMVQASRNYAERFYKGGYK